MSAVSITQPRKLPRQCLNPEPVRTDANETQRGPWEVESKQVMDRKWREGFRRTGQGGRFRELRRKQDLRGLF